MFDYQRKGYSVYGASMGRESTLDFDTEDKCIIRLVPINNQGYDPGGAYWGTPSNLYYVESLDSGEVKYLRGQSIDNVKALFPYVTWITDFSDGDLADFLQAYIECALWSSNDESDDRSGEPLDANYSADDLSPETLAIMTGDCKQFVMKNIKDITDFSQAGHDFWLTRNHHGAGFWDRGLGDAGERLTDAAHAYGSVDLYVGDDGKIYQG